MNITIHLPEVLVLSFLWGCVAVSVLGLIMLLAAWGKRVLEQRHGYWLLVLHLSLRQNAAKEWTWGMFSRLVRELREENPKLLQELKELFNEEVK